MGAGHPGGGGRLAALRWAWLGRVPYRPAWALQEELRRRVLELGEADTLLLLEHDPVVTLGRHADRANVLVPEAALAAAGVELVATTRGGDVTYHGPGQLVGYPVSRVPRGPRAHLEALAEALRRVCAELGVTAAWRERPAGLWVGDHKLAAFGLHVTRGVAVHGFALNVTTRLDAFDRIVPCGLRRAGVTSLAAQGVAAPPLAALAPRVAAAIGAVLERPLVAVDPALLWRLIPSDGPIQWPASAPPRR
jgi:lipoyl(octanoyl) transferase